MALKIIFRYKNLSLAEKRHAEEYARGRMERIEKYAPSSDTRVQVRIEKFAKKAAYNVELELHAPKMHVMASEDDHTIAEAVDFAIDKLVRQISRSVGLTRPRHHKYPRAHAVRQQWKQFEEHYDIRDTEEEEQQEFFSRASALSKRLVRMLAHEVHVQGREGDEDLAPETLVDEAIIRVWDGRKRRTKGMTLEQSLYHVALGILEERAQKGARTQRAEMSLDQVIHADSEASRISNIGDEVKDFWQPDELLTIADTIGTRTGTGGLTASQKKQHHQVLAALTKFTAQQRQAFLLAYKEGFSPDEIAMIQKRKIAVVERDLHDVLGILRGQFSP